MTSKKKKRYSYWVSQNRGRLRGHGEFPVGGKSVTVRGVAQQPEWMFEQALRFALRRQGIQIDQAVSSEDKAQPALSRSSRAAEVLHVHRSGLEQALGPILRDSSNFHAEQVLRVLGARLGRRGDFATGCRILREQLASRTSLPANLAIVDGSGLSRGNRVSPSYLVALIRTLCGSEHGKLLVANLSRGGVDGTMRRRFSGRKDVGRAVRGKTGTINGVKSLSGIVQLPGGAVRVFSILMNKRKGTSTRGANALQERILAVIHRGG